MRDVKPGLARTTLKRRVRHRRLLYDFHTDPPSTLAKAYEKVRLAVEAEQREVELNEGRGGPR